MNEKLEMTKKTKKSHTAFAYYRVSVPKQGEKETWKTQQRECKIYAMDNNIEIVEEFIEVKSGTTRSLRKVFNKMLTKIGEVDGLLVFDLDRATRDPYHFAKILNLFQELNKKIWQVSGELDLNDDEDILLARIKTDIAEYEVSKIKKRQKAGIARFREKHGHWGRRTAIITNGSFEKWLDKNGKLMFPKTVIAKILGVSTPILRRWMRENDYGHLINKIPEELRRKK